MRKKINTNLLLSSCLFVLMGSTPALGQQFGLLPPDAIYRGRTLAQWNGLAAEWNIAMGLGDASGLSDTVDGVRFLPQPVGAGEFEFDVILPAGTAFLYGSFGVSGERYSDGSQDNPADPIIPQIFADATIETILDGNVLLAGKAANHSNRLVGPIFSDPPIFYNQPQPRGTVDAVAAVWHMGVAGLYRLPFGAHTLENTIESEFFGNTHVTYHINVVPEPSTVTLEGVGVIGLLAAARRQLRVN